MAAGKRTRSIVAHWGCLWELMVADSFGSLPVYSPRADTCLVVGVLRRWEASLTLTAAGVEPPCFVVIVLGSTTSLCDGFRQPDSMKFL